MVKSVVREHHWPPDVIGGLYFDDEDREGLIYWYNDVVAMHKELEDAQKKKKTK